MPEGRAVFEPLKCACCGFTSSRLGFAKVTVAGKFRGRMRHPGEYLRVECLQEEGLPVELGPIFTFQYHP